MSELARRILHEARTHFPVRSLLRGGFRSDQERIFSLNSGNCGSWYIVELLKANGLGPSYHQKMPDFEELGVRYYLTGKPAFRMLWLLRLTRHDVYFESSNRLFSMTPLITRAYPNARFIHQHRDPLDTIVSTINKNIWPDWMQNPTRLRYSSMLSGARDLLPFERTCHYWNNYNRRIMDDLKGMDYLSLKFTDLINGRIQELEEFIGHELKIKKIPPVNTKEVLKERGKKYDSFDALPDEWQRAFHRICGATRVELGYQSEAELRALTDNQS